MEYFLAYYKFYPKYIEICSLKYRNFCRTLSKLFDKLLKVKEQLLTIQERLPKFQDRLPKIEGIIQLLNI